MTTIHLEKQALTIPYHTAQWRMCRRTWPLVG